MGLTELCSAKVDYQIAQNTRCWVHPLSTKMDCHSKWRGIHCLWSVSKPSWDAWDGWEELLIEYIYQLLDPLSHFLPRLALKFHTKCHIFNSLSVQKMGCCATRRGIHCSWSIPIPSLNALSWWYELTCAYFCHSWVSPRHFPPRLTLKMHTKCQIFSTLSVRKWDAIIQWEVSIAYEVFPNLP